MARNASPSAKLSCRLSVTMSDTQRSFFPVSLPLTIDAISEEVKFKKIMICG